MVVEEINLLKEQLNSQIKEKDSYDMIYETSVKIDKLLIKYYEEKYKGKRILGKRINN